MPDMVETFCSADDSSVPSDQLAGNLGDPAGYPYHVTSLEALEQSQNCMNPPQLVQHVALENAPISCFLNISWRIRSYPILRRGVSQALGYGVL